jgi:hypothetical protein
MDDTVVPVAGGGLLAGLAARAGRGAAAVTRPKVIGDSG